MKKYLSIMSKQTKLKCVGVIIMAFIPPHERKAMIHLEFGEDDWGLLKDVFGDEDTAAAAASIIQGAPPEIQILAVQLIDVLKEEVA